MPLSVEDRMDIHELYARYAVLFDSGEADLWAACFAPDGRFLAPGRMSMTGREALAEFARKRIVEARGISHHVTNITIAATASGAAGSAYAIVLRNVAGEPPRLRNVGRYSDELVRLDAGWAFASRQFDGWLSPEYHDMPLHLPAIPTS
jgi:hypothetical protein